MKTLFLHIGIPKTATSAIQQFCAKNRDVMQSKGYYYPFTLMHYPAVNDVCNAHFMIGTVKDKDGNRDHAEEERLFALGMENIHKYFNEYDNVVLSDEKIWYSSSYVFTDLWDKLKADADANDYTVKFIIYLRRQDEFLSSRWNQLVKEGTCSEPWDEHLKNAPVKLAGILDYAAKINGLAELFGKENIIVRRFDRNGFYGGNIYSDFFQCLGLEVTNEYQKLKDDSNLSLRGNTFEVKRIINTAPGVVKENNPYWRKMVSKCSSTSGKYYKYSMFSKEDAQNFINIYREGNEQIAADYIKDGAPLFSYEVEDTEKWDSHNEYMLDDVIRIFAVTANDLHEEIVKLKKDNKQLGSWRVNDVKQWDKSNEYVLLDFINSFSYTANELTAEIAKLKAENQALKKEIQSNNQRLDRAIEKLKHPIRTIFGGSKKG